MKGLAKTTLTTTAIAACLALPAAAQQSQSQDLSAEGEACVERLQEMDRHLAEIGYGRVGPSGYGAYGAPYAQPGGTPADGTMGTGALGTWGHTPASDMRALMRAGYIMAMQGYDDSCQSVVTAVEDIGNRYEDAIRSGDPEEMARWRNEFLGATTPVTELEQPLSVEDILGADIRNLRDENLGDIEDVVMGRDGGIRYVIVSTGGFLGIGDDEVPVRWSDLQLTSVNYGITFVLDIEEEAFAEAPRLGDRQPEELLAEDSSAELDTYWDEAGLGEMQDQNQ